MRDADRSVKAYAPLFLVFGLGVLLLGCADETEPREVIPLEESATLIVAGVVPGEDDSNRTSVVHPYLLEGTTIRTGAPINATVGPQPALSWAEPQSAVLTVRGDDLFLAHAAASPTVERHRPFDPAHTVQSVAIAERAGALMALGPHCYVGHDMRVDRIDFTERRPKSVLVHEDRGLQKVVDFFVRLGEGRLLAIDDVVLPKYAMLFDLDERGRATHTLTFELPSAPNEFYTHAAAEGDLLVMTARFHHMGGNGNALVRADLAEPEFDRYGKLVAERHEDYLDQLSSGDPDAPEPRLLAGETWTAWRGLGVLGGRIFIGAGARGILHLPVDGDDAELIDVGGECLDLVVAQDKVIALVRTDEDDAGRTLLVLGWQEQTSTTEILAQHDLTEPLDRLLR